MPDPEIIIINDGAPSVVVVDDKEPSHIGVHVDEIHVYEGPGMTAAELSKFRLRVGGPPVAGIVAPTHGAKTWTPINTEGAILMNRECILYREFERIYEGSPDNGYTHDRDTGELVFSHDLHEGEHIEFHI